MKHGIWVALFLLVAPAGALAQQASAGGADEKAAGPGARKAPRKGTKAKEPATPTVSPATKRIARQTKSIFIFAVESCTREGSRCDPTLASDAELRFLNACGACNSAERCEAERDTIRAGEGRASRDPCAP